MSNYGFDCPIDHSLTLPSLRNEPAPHPMTEQYADMRASLPNDASIALPTDVPSSVLVYHKLMYLSRLACTFMLMPSQG